MSITLPALDISVTRLLPAPPERVYALVCDVTRMSDHSPETVAVRWLDGATSAAVGARFLGRNRIGMLSWSTIATVTAAEPGSRFAFETSAPSRSTWTYTFEAVDGGTLVTESMRKDDPQPLVIRCLQRAVGVRDRAAHLEDQMNRTLERLAAALETS